MGGKRDAADIMKGAHDGAAPGLYRGLERRQIDVMQCLRCDFGGVVITPAFRCTVTDKVFGAGDDTIDRELLGNRVLLIALKTSDRRCGQFPCQKGVFAKALGNSPPARVAGDIEHGREPPMDTVGTRFSGGDRVGGLNQPG